MTKNKSHYRKVFKSDHLGVADLEDMLETSKTLIFTVDHVKQEWGARVAGKKGNFNIAYFKENIKPWVVNATNSKIMRSIAGGSIYVEDWKDFPVQLYIDPTVKYKGDIVGGVKLNPNRPQLQKTELQPDTPAWGNAIDAYKRDGNFDKIEARMTISEGNKALIMEASASEVV